MVPFWICCNGKDDHAMTDEVVDLSKTLVWTVGMITQAGPDER